MDNNIKYKNFGRKDVVKGLSVLEGISPSQARRIVDYVMESYCLALLSGHKIYLPKLGSLFLKLSETKRGVHPLKLIPLVVPPSLRVRFKSSTTLQTTAKDYVPFFVERYLSGLTEEERQAYDERAQKVEEEVQQEKDQRGLT